MVGDIFSISGLKENHQRRDHVDHIVCTYGMLPVTPGEHDRHGQAIKQSSDQKPLQVCSTVSQAEGDRAEQYGDDHGYGWAPGKGRT